MSRQKNNDEKKKKEQSLELNKPRATLNLNLVNHWILGSFLKDSLALYSGAFAAFLYFMFVNPFQSSFALALFLVTSLIDTGHVYLTLWRVIWKSPAQKQLSLLLFLAVFLLSFLWMTLKGIGFWSFVLYFTIFHHIRQYYGITRWYEKKNKRLCVLSSYFLYALTLLPLMAFHFRNLPLTVYSQGDLFLFPSPKLLTLSTNLYFLTLFLYVIFEVSLILKHRHTQGIEINRISSIVFPSLLHGLCFFIGKNLYSILFPLLVIHGVSYFWIISLTLEKTSPHRKFQNWKVALLASFLLMLLGGSWESLLNTTINNYDYLGADDHLFKCAILTILVTPNLWHYLVDAFIWKSTDKEAAKIYAQ